MARPQGSSWQNTHKTIYTNVLNWFIRHYITKEPLQKGLTLVVVDCRLGL